MENDDIPWVAPQPKPTTLEIPISTIKPGVPDVSVICTGNGSSIWQVSGHSIHLNRNEALQSNDGARIEDRRSSVNIIQPWGVASSSGPSSVNPSFAQSHVTSLARFPTTRTADRPIPKMIAPPLADRAISAASSNRQYNPQAYSPIHKRSYPSTQPVMPPPVYQKDSPLARQTTSRQQPIASPAAGSISSSNTKSVQFSLSSHHVGSRHSTPPQISKSQAPGTRVLYPLVESGSVGIRNNQSYPPLTSKLNKENVDPFSTPRNQVTRIPTISKQQDKEVLFRERNETPTSYDLLTRPSFTPPSMQSVRYPNPLNPSVRYSSPDSQNMRYSTPVTQSVQSTDPTYISTIERKIPGGTDPLVYQLIEEQSQQILNLSKSLQRLMDKQESNVSAREDQPERVMYARGTPEKKTVVYRDMATQTVHPETKDSNSVAINTDISWPELLASIIYNNIPEDSTNENQSTPELAIESSNEHQSGLDPNHGNCKYQQIPVKNVDDRRASLECSSAFSEEEGAASVSQNINVTSHQVFVEHHLPPPVCVPDLIHRSAAQEYNTRSRGQGCDGDRPSSLLIVGDSVSSSPHNQQQQLLLNLPPAPSQPPVGTTTFYSNVMTNIQHLLKNTDTEQEQHQQQDQQQHYQQQQQQQQQPQVVDSDVPADDPKIEAVRKQLMQFGISFIDPATLTTNNHANMDSMYQPCLHNMLSLYQSTISTTHHQYHPDTAAAKYLTDSQLAAIAARSPAMVRNVNRERGQRHPQQSPASTQESRGQLYQGSHTNNFSITTQNFLQKYGLQED